MTEMTGDVRSVQAGNGKPAKQASTTPGGKAGKEKSKGKNKSEGKSEGDNKGATAKQPPVEQPQATKPPDEQPQVEQPQEEQPQVVKSLLPTEKSKPSFNLLEYTIMIYGPPGVGKTTFAASFPSTIVLDCERGTKTFELYSVMIKDWKHFLAVCRELAMGKHKYKMIAIDTIDSLYEMCRHHVLQNRDTEYEGDLPQGKGWAIVRNEFRRVLTILSRLPYGLILAAHSKTIEIESKIGKYNRTVAAFQDKPLAFILGLSDIVMHINMILVNKDGQEKFVRGAITEPSLYWDGKDRSRRLPAKFKLTDDDGEPIGYDQFSRFFHKGHAPENIAEAAKQAVDSKNKK